MQNCRLSYGGVWVKAGKKDFSKLVEVADERMYQSKNAFYRKLKKAGISPERLSFDLKNSSPENGKDSFKIFSENYYFDANSFFHSIQKKDSILYLYCGDMKKNVYYISDNLKNDFNFPSNLIYDFVSLLEQRIFEGDRQRHVADAQAMLAEKKTNHSIRYRMYNKNGELVWIHCHGIIKWNEDKTEPLFFSGSMTLLNNQSEIDEATGMVSFSHALTRISDLYDSGENLLVIGFSLSNFLNINQLFGREVGDKILSEIEAQMKKELGNDFYFIHIDGPRFMAVSESVQEPKDPVWNIQRIVQNVYRRNEVHIMYPCAVGVLRMPQDVKSVHDLVESVMALLSEAQAVPSNEYLEYSPRLSEKYKKRADISIELNASVHRLFEGFRIVIQPQVFAETGKIFGGEVLLRWKHQDVDVSPNIFIPILEQTGLIVPVGKWVIYESIAACRDILHIFPDFQLSLNVSYLQLMDETLITYIRKRWELSKFPVRTFSSN